MHHEEELLPLSALQHLIYCERRAALVHIEQCWRESVATVEGRHLHQLADEENSRELHGDVLTVRGLRLRSLTLGLAGMADAVEFHRVPAGAGAEVDLTELVELRGRKGLWRVFPVEYKRGRKRVEKAYLVQLCAQALCLEDMLGVRIQSGAVFFGKSRRRLDVDFDEELRADVVDAAERLHRLFRSGLTPPAEYSRKCDECSLFDECLPKTVTRKKSVGGYLKSAFNDQEI